MNEADKEFLWGMMHERMTQHYAAHHQKPGSSPEPEEQFTRTLAALPKEQAETVHRYLEYLFEKSADAERLYYRCGLIDGIRLLSYIQSLTVS